MRHIPHWSIRQLHSLLVADILLLVVVGSIDHSLHMYGDVFLHMTNEIELNLKRKNIMMDENVDRKTVTIRTEFQTRIRFITVRNFSTDAYITAGKWK